jgi:3-hydroxyacyl-[acyl-carrier-protein] dehydratase
MRWLWVDRFTEFVSGHRCAAVKCVALDEEVLDRYSALPVFPCSVMIEGLAQCGGILVSEHVQFAKRVVLAKVVQAVFHEPAMAGDQLKYTAVLESVQPEGAIVQCTVHNQDLLLAELQLMFAYLDDSFLANQRFFAPADLRHMLHLMRMYDVAVDAEGRPLAVSDNLFEVTA